MLLSERTAFNLIGYSSLFFLRSDSSLQYPKADYKHLSMNIISPGFKKENEKFEVRENKVSLAGSCRDVCLSVQNAGRETPTAKERKGACLLPGVTIPIIFSSFITLSFIFNTKYSVRPNGFYIWLLFYTSTTFMNNVLQFITT